MKIGVLSAMSKEHQQLTTLLTEAHTKHDGNLEFTVGSLGANTLILMQCGIGKVNAAVGTTALIRRFSPDCIVSTGCAGGVDASLNVMDVVVSTFTTYHDVTIPGCEVGQIQGLPARFRSEQELVEVALRIQSPSPAKDECGGAQPSGEQKSASSVGSGGRVSCGLICTGDQFISDRAQLQHIKAQFPEALAVDMESAAIAQTCFLHAIPFVSFRILSDTPGADEHILQYLNFWDEMADRSFDITRRFLGALPAQFSVLHFEE